MRDPHRALGRQPARVSRAGRSAQLTPTAANASATMRSGSMSRSLRVAMLAMLLGGMGIGTSPASARWGTKVVRYHGYRLSVPASWPVYGLSAHPKVCARFNRHAVYLGSPGSEQRCPAHAVGRTEAILLAPLKAAAARSSAAGAAPLPGSGRAQPQQGSETRLVIRS